jgi:hypothetical protein
MKITIKILFVILILFGLNNACKKNNNTVSNPKGNSQIVLSKTRVNRGERLTASLKSTDPNSKIKWTIVPAASSQVMPANDKAAAIFALAGSYRITASYYTLGDSSVAYDSSSAPVTVTDSIDTTPVFTPFDDGLDTASLEGDQITLIPISASDSGLVMLAKTTRLYNCAPYLTGYGAGGGPGNSNSFLLYEWGEVVEGSTDCKGAKNPAIAYFFYDPLKNGSYNISAELNNITYQGVLTVTNTDYTFSWNYSSGFIISPLQIKRH